MAMGVGFAWSGVIRAELVRKFEFEAFGCTMRNFKQSNEMMPF